MKKVTKAELNAFMVILIIPIWLIQNAYQNQDIPQWGKNIIIAILSGWVIWVTCALVVKFKQYYEN